MAGIIVGRALQGAGAVGSVILAMLADLTSEESRTKAMAMVGITIGASFLIALVAGPIAASADRRAGHFLADGRAGRWRHRDHAVRGADAAAARSASRCRNRAGVASARVLRNPALLGLNVGIFVLHAMLTAIFLVCPACCAATLNVAPDNDWMIYLPVLLVSVVVMGGGDRAR